MANPIDPTITPAALLPRQIDSNFVGWFSQASVSGTDAWIRSSCASGDVWRQSGNYAQCCPSTAICYTAIDCTESQGQAYRIYTDPGYSTTFSRPCFANFGPEYSKCNTDYISSSWGQNDPDPKTLIACGNSGADWVFYRDIPPSLTEQGSTSSTSSLPGTSSSSSSGTSTSSSSGTSSTTPVAPTQTPKPESGSKAWIAGAVVGPILGLVLIGAGVWLFLRRKKKAAPMPQHGVAATAHFDPSQPPVGVGGYTDAKPQNQPAQHAYPSSAQGQAYPQQGGFSPPQMSPAPQYGFSPPYNATPSPRGSYAHDAKYEAEAAELGGSSTIAPGAAPSGQGRR